MDRTRSCSTRGTPRARPGRCTSPRFGSWPTVRWSSSRPGRSRAAGREQRWVAGGSTSVARGVDGCPCRGRSDRPTFGLPNGHSSRRRTTLPYITTSDGTELYYTSQGRGPVVILSHSWPLSSDAWQVEVKLLADSGYRAIAHDRRGHGRSAKTYAGNDMDTYARDLAEIVEQLDLDEVSLIGHSAGGGEVIRYAAQHGAGRVRRIFTVGGVAPILVESEANPHGTPIETLDAMRAGVLRDASQFWIELAESFYGADRPGGAISEGVRRDFWRQGQLLNLAAAYDGVEAFSETDFTDDLRALDVPIFLAHGDDDQIVPVGVSAEKSIALVSHGTLKVYPGAPHGISGSYQAALDQDILAFLSEKPSIV
ncbi:alpha/beta fold hydrolase [Microbacterium sp. P01]|uniref:alpha/beta fold hydrolase n=1 Tax=unclassified Microbacterium TaxID=2609290 RepID=UPI0036728567